MYVPNYLKNVTAHFCIEFQDNRIRRGPKLEGYAFANFGYSSETDGESHHEMGNSVWISFFVCV